jgi:hypothetical protein
MKINAKGSSGRVHFGHVEFNDAAIPGGTQVLVVPRRHENGCGYRYGKIAEKHREDILKKGMKCPILYSFVVENLIGFAR